MSENQQRSNSLVSFMERSAGRSVSNGRQPSDEGTFEVARTDPTGDNPRELNERESRTPNGVYSGESETSHSPESPQSPRDQVSNLHSPQNPRTGSSPAPDSPTASTMAHPPDSPRHVIQSASTANEAMLSSIEERAALATDDVEPARHDDASPPANTQPPASPRERGRLHLPRQLYSLRQRFLQENGQRVGVRQRLHSIRENLRNFENIMRGRPSAEK